MTDDSETDSGRMDGRVIYAYRGTIGTHNFKREGISGWVLSIASQAVAYQVSILRTSTVQRGGKVIAINIG